MAPSIKAIRADWRKGNMEIVRCKFSMFLIQMRYNVNMKNCSHDLWKLVDPKLSSRSLVTIVVKSLWLHPVDEKLALLKYPTTLLGWQKKQRSIRGGCRWCFQLAVPKERAGLLQGFDFSNYFISPKWIVRQGDLPSEEYTSSANPREIVYTVDGVSESGVMQGRQLIMECPIRKSCLIKASVGTVTGGCHVVSVNLADHKYLLKLLDSQIYGHCRGIASERN